MSKRQSSTQCQSAGMTAVLHMPANHRLNKKQHSADGAKVKIITNRFSGIVVELCHNHGIYDKGDQLQVSPGDLVTGELAALKLSLANKK